MIRSFYHDGYAAPLGDHVMPINKFALVAERVRALDGVELVEPEALTEADLRRVHTQEYIDAVRSGEPRGLAESQKFPWSPQLFPSVLLTGGGCLAAAREALRAGIAAAIVSGFHHWPRRSTSTWPISASATAWCSPGRGARGCRSHGRSPAATRPTSRRSWRCTSAPSTPLGPSMPRSDAT